MVLILDEMHLLCHTLHGVNFFKLLYLHFLPELLYTAVLFFPLYFLIRWMGRALLPEKSDFCPSPAFFMEILDSRIF